MSLVDIAIILSAVWRRAIMGSNDAKSLSNPAETPLTYVQRARARDMTCILTRLNACAARTSCACGLHAATDTRTYIHWARARVLWPCGTLVWDACRERMGIMHIQVADIISANLVNILSAVWIIWPRFNATGKVDYRCQINGKYSEIIVE